MKILLFLVLILFVGCDSRETGSMRITTYVNGYQDTLYKIQVYEFWSGDYYVWQDYNGIETSNGYFLRIPPAFQFKNKIEAEKKLKWCLAFRDSIKRREYHSVK